MKPWQALVWNEWRQHQWRFYLLSAVTIFAWSALVFIYSFKIFTKDVIEFLVLIIGVGLSISYLITAVGGFHNDFVFKTSQFNFGLPVKPHNIYWIKIGVGFLYLVTLILLNYFAILVSTNITKTFLKKAYDPAVVSSVIALFLYVPAYFSTLVHGRENPSKTINPLWSINLLVTLPGIFYATMYFFSNFETWFISTLTLWYLIVLIFCLRFGEYLWTNYVCRALKLGKTLFAVSSILIFFSLLAWASTFFISYIQLSAARRQAKEHGLILSLSKPIPDSENTTSDFKTFGEIYKKFMPEGLLTYIINKTNRATQQHETNDLSSKQNETEKKRFSEKIFGPLRKKSSKPKKMRPCRWTKTYFSYYGKQCEDISLHKAKEAAEYIFKNPEIKNLEKILDNALKEPELRYSLDFESMNLCSIESESRLQNKAMKSVLNYIMNRSYAYASRGEFTRFLKSIKQINRLAAFYRADIFSSHFHQTILMYEKKYQTIIAATPDDIKYSGEYREFLKEIDSINLIIPNDKLWIMNLTSESFKIDIDHYTTVFLPRHLFLPKIQQLNAQLIHWELQRCELLRQFRYKNNFEKIKKQTRILASPHPFFLAFSGSESEYYESDYEESKIKHFFINRVRFDILKIALALKIFKAENGSFPDKLAELQPGILPEIPTNAMDGKSFKYQREGEGFKLEGDKMKYGHEFLIDYQTCGNGK